MSIVAEPLKLRCKGCGTTVPEDFGLEQHYNDTRNGWQIYKLDGWRCHKCGVLNDMNCGDDGEVRYMGVEEWEAYKKLPQCECALCKVLGRPMDTVLSARLEDGRIVPLRLSHQLTGQILKMFSPAERLAASVSPQHAAPAK